MPDPKIFFNPLFPPGEAKPASRARSSPARPQKKTTAARSPRAAAAEQVRGWKLMVINQEPIRRAAVLAYRQANEQMAGLRERMAHHATADQPAYGGWLAAAFGPLLTELREVEDQIADKGSMLRAVRMLMMLGGLSPHRAYREILRGKAERERFEARAAAGEEDLEDEADFAEDDDDSLFEGMPDALRRMFGIPPGKAGAEKPSPDDAQARSEPRRPADRRRRAGPTAEPTPAQQNARQQLKAAYRAVVRRLHPDLRADLTDYDRQLWHAAQNAYDQGDLERLETILAISEMGGSGELPVGSGLGGLLALIRQSERAVGQLQRQLRALKKSPAWDFTRLAAGEKRKLAQKAAAALRADLADAKAELAHIETQLAFCAQPPRQAKSKSAKPAKGGKNNRRKKE